LLLYPLLLLLLKSEGKAEDLIPQAAQLSR